MRFINNDIVFPDKDLYPLYRLNAFETRDIKTNTFLPESNLISDFLYERHKNRKIIFTQSGRSAIDIALSSISLNKNDIVTIFTTSNNTYISKCVTDEIEKHCLWSRKFEKETKAILVNHEFGYSINDVEKYKKYNVPIIEDLAYSFNSNNKNHTAGQIGDFVIYSFSKFFPVQFGGALVCKNKYNIVNKTPESVSQAVINIISYYVNKIDEFSELRLNNYKIYLDVFKNLKVYPFFRKTENNIPGVFLFDIQYDIEINKLKNFFWQNGVHCSVFYGKKAFFLPIHHRITKFDIKYFYKLFTHFLKN